MKKSKLQIATIAILLSISLQGFCQEVSLGWAGQFGGTRSAYVNDIALTSSGDIVAAGFFEETVDFDPGPGTFNLTSGGKSDIFVVKLDANQQFVWARHFPGAGSDRGYALTVSDDGSSYITGEFEGTADFDPGTGVFTMTSESPQGCFITKLNSNGDLVWAKQLQSTVSNHRGSAITMDPSGDILVAGFFDGQTDFDPGPGTFPIQPVGGTYGYVWRLGPDGEFRWAKSFGGNNAFVMVNDVKVDLTGNIHFCGYYSGTPDFDPGTGTVSLTSAGGSDSYLVKLDNSGNLIWAKSFGGPNGDYCNGVAVDQSGAVYGSGYFLGTADFDPGPGVTNLVAERNNIFLIKLTREGELSWANSLTGTNNDYGKGITLDPQGRIYITGCFKGTTDFDPGPSTHSLTTKGDYDFFISKYDASGNLIRVNQMSGTSWECGNKLIVDPAGNIYAGGYFGGSPSFNPNGTGNSLTAKGITDAFIVKLLQETSGTEQFEKSSEYLIYPNPTQGLLTISRNDPSEGCVIRILDIQGRILSEKVIPSGQPGTVDMNNQTPGLYIIELETSKGQIREKIIRY